MRSYWIKILIGAAGIFALGMVGVTLARRGLGTVHSVVHGTGPISIPVPFVPFDLGGGKLGTVERVVLERNAPNQISSVQVHIQLADSLIAQGLSGCRLAANFDTSHDGSKGVHVKPASRGGGTFRCLKSEQSDSSLEEFGQALLQPGGVTLGLLLPKDLVNDLRTGHFFDDSTDKSDSLSAAMEALGDSIEAAQENKIDSLNEWNNRLADSLRAAGRVRIDSIRGAALRLADSARAASLKENASRPR